MVCEADGASIRAADRPANGYAMLWERGEGQRRPSRDRRPERPPSPVASRDRPIWSDGERERYRALGGPGRRPAVFSPVETFYRQLVQELQRALPQKQPLSLIVLQLPGHWPGDAADRRAVEIAVRLEVRQADLLTRLSTRTLAVALPETGEGGRVVVTRLEGLLSRMVHEPVPAGIAFFPRDGPTAAELLRMALWRSLSGRPERRQDPELERFLGPLVPALPRGERQSEPGRKEKTQGR